MLNASDQNESKEGHTKGSDECSGDSVGGRKDESGDVDKTSDSTELLTGPDKDDPDADEPEQGKANPKKIIMCGSRTGTGVPDPLKKYKTYRMA